MKKEIKDILQLLVIFLPACAIIYVWWLNSPMYKAAYEQQRLEAQSYLIKTYYERTVAYDKQDMMKHYKLTDDDINPDKLLEKWAESYEINN